MNIGQRVVCALVLTTAVWPVQATDFYWSCTTAVGTRYADATRCDKGDTAVQVAKSGAGNDSNAGNRGTGGQPAQPLACQRTPAYCGRPDYDVVEASARSQAITHFMRQKECEFLLRFPQRCGNPD